LLSVLSVCLERAGGVCLWVCYHNNSKLRASILTKLGLQVKVQLIKFWPSRAPGKGVYSGAKIFWRRLTTASAQYLYLSALFQFFFVLSFIRATFCVLLVYVGMFSVFWLF